MSKTYYCKRCDTDGHTWSHRCFVYGLKRIRPLLKKPEEKPNTLLARKLAKIYEKEYKQSFPGGVENAFIRKETPATIRAWGDAGSWSWTLESKDNLLAGNVSKFGHNRPATECAKIGRVMTDASNAFSNMEGIKE